MNLLQLFVVVTVLTWCSGCNPSHPKQRHANFEKNSTKNQKSEVLPLICVADTPVITEVGVSGTYRGVEFVSIENAQRMHLNGTDVAHQYSNKMCEYVGKELKRRFLKGKYSKVDFSHIRMQTKGMKDGDDYVVYSVFIPFLRVTKSQATTAFDHCGGWGHIPDLKERKEALLHGTKKIVKNNHLQISRKFETPEGLQEFWIQWQHSDFQ